MRESQKLDVLTHIGRKVEKLSYKLKQKDKEISSKKRNIKL